MTQTGTPQYDISRVFALLTSKKETSEILQILKRMGHTISPNK